MESLVLAFCLSACLLSLQIVAREVPAETNGPFTSLRAPGETIKHYEVHVPVMSNEVLTSNEHPDSFDLQISDYLIHLELNSGLVSPGFTSHSFDEDENIIVEKGHVNCFYHGSVEGHPQWHVAMSTCHGIQGSFGELGSGDNYYHVEPLDKSNFRLEQPHALYSSNEYSTKLETCGVNSQSHPADHIPLIPDHVHVDRNRVRRLVNGFYIVEWAVINDFTQYDIYGRNLSATVLRDLEIANFVDSLYRTLSVRVVVVHALTWTTGDRITYPADNDPNILLDNLRDYEPQITAVHDSTMLITGVDILGNTVGIAFIGTMCRGRSSVGLSQDGSRSLSATGSTVAHELGHIFRMNHDDGRQCSCTDPSGDCIMSAVSGFPSPVEWSSCSRSDISDGFTEDNLNSCLDNEPQTTVGDPLCGNGIREGEEICDCGTLEECQDPCCNATACILREGAECFSGDCCTDDCQFVPPGTTCRPAAQECDIEEFCPGDTSSCPRDLHKQDTSPCNDEDFCFGGECRVRDDQCQKFFGSDSGSERCYSEVNVRGDQFGNCGSGQGAFLPCDPEHVRCGQLQCGSGQFTDNGVAGAFTILTFGIAGETCRSFTTSPNSDALSPGLVADGTRCAGNDSVCVSQECMKIADLDFIVSCPRGSSGEICSGTGICNNLNQCSCSAGRAGATCEQEVEGGGRGSSNAGAIAGGVIGAILGLLLAAAVAVGVIFLVLKCRSKRDKAYLPKPALAKARTKPVSKPLTASQDNLLNAHASVDVRPSPSTSRTYKAPAYVRSPSPPPVRPAPSPGQPSYRQPPPSRAVPPAPSRKDPPRSGPPPRRPPPTNAPPPRTPQPPKPSTAPPPKPSNKPPPAAPKPGKIQAQWPPPAETEAKKPVPAPPRKPVYPPRR